MAFAKAMENQQAATLKSKTALQQAANARSTIRTNQLNPTHATGSRPPISNVPRSTTTPVANIAPVVSSATPTVTKVTGKFDEVHKWEIVQPNGGSIVPNDWTVLDENAVAGVYDVVGTDTRRRDCNTLIVGILLKGRIGSVPMLVLAITRIPPLSRPDAYSVDTALAMVLKWMDKLVPRETRDAIAQALKTVPYSDLHGKPYDDEVMAVYDAVFQCAMLLAAIDAKSWAINMSRDACFFGVHQPLSVRAAVAGALPPDKLNLWATALDTVPTKTDDQIDHVWAFVAAWGRDEFKPSPLYAAANTLADKLLKVKSNDADVHVRHALMQTRLDSIDSASAILTSVPLLGTSVVVAAKQYGLIAEAVANNAAQLKVLDVPAGRDAAENIVQVMFPIYSVVRSAFANNKIVPMLSAVWSDCAAGALTANDNGTVTGVELERIFGSATTINWGPPLLAIFIKGIGDLPPPLTAGDIYGKNGFAYSGKQNKLIGKARKAVEALSTYESATDDGDFHTYTCHWAPKATDITYKHLDDADWDKMYRTSYISTKADKTRLDAAALLVV